MNSRTQAAANEAGNETGAWLFGLLAWMMPGVGHIWQGRFARGLLMGGSIWLLFILGLLAGGHLYSPASAQDIGMLAYFFTFFDFGSGLLYILSIFMGVGTIEQAQRITADYGNLFLMIAGLLNYLTALDAFDIGARRKS